MAPIFFFILENGKQERFYLFILVYCQLLKSLFRCKESVVVHITNFIFVTTTNCISRFIYFFKESWFDAWSSIPVREKQEELKMCFLSAVKVAFPLHFLNFELFVYVLLSARVKINV